MRFRRHSNRQARLEPIVWSHDRTTVFGPSGRSVQRWECCSESSKKNELEDNKSKNGMDHRLRGNSIKDSKTTKLDGRLSIINFRLISLRLWVEETAFEIEASTKHELGHRNTHTHTWQSIHTCMNDKTDTTQWQTRTQTSYRVTQHERLMRRNTDRRQAQCKEYTQSCTVSD